MNFGETLTYWYLRLNGFFPITDFVLHRGDKVLPRSADCDLLAVRFPFVFEEVGGQENDWDLETFRRQGLDLNQGITALIVEVKTGADSKESRENIQLSFNEDRLLYGIQRFGYWQRQEAREIARKLLGVPFYVLPEGNITVAKLLVAIDMPERDIPPCLQIELDDVDYFVGERMNKYIKYKYADRLRFPSDLMQYIIWNEKRNIDS